MNGGTREFHIEELSRRIKDSDRYGTLSIHIYTDTAKEILALLKEPTAVLDRVTEILMKRRTELTGIYGDLGGAMNGVLLLIQEVKEKEGRS